MDSRRQKRMNKDESEKKLVALWNKRTRLREGQHYEWVQLPKPVRAGYERFFVLRDDIVRSPDVSVYRPLLQWVNTTVTSRNKDFMYKDWKTKKKKPIEQSIKSISHTDWIKKVEPTLTVKQKSMFLPVWHHNTTRRNGKTVMAPGGYWTYEFQKSWVFVYKIQPYFHTHAVIINPQIESELKEIYNRIETHHLWPKFIKIFGWDDNRDWDWESARQRIISRIIDKESNQEHKTMHLYE